MTDDFSCYRSREEAHLIWHYTSSGFEDILRTKTIWLSDARYLNDGAELAWVDGAVKAGALAAASNPARGPMAAEAMQRKREAVEWIFSSQNRLDVYVGCFSQFGDSLSQWRDYAGRYGAAFGFDRMALEQLADDFGVKVRPCFYGKDPSDFQAPFRSLFGIGSWLLREALGGRRPDLTPAYLEAATLKHIGFRPEAEIRAIFMPTLPGGDRLPIEPHLLGDIDVRHVSLPWRVGSVCALRKIRLAPSFGSNRQALEDKAQQMAKRHDVAVPIWPSDIPYRWRGDSGLPEWAR